MRFTPGLVPVMLVIAVTGCSPLTVAPSAGSSRQTVIAYEPSTGPLVWQVEAVAFAPPDPTAKPMTRSRRTKTDASRGRATNAFRTLLIAMPSREPPPATAPPRADRRGDDQHRQSERAEVQHVDPRADDVALLLRRAAVRGHEARLARLGPKVEPGREAVRVRIEPRQRPQAPVVLDEPENRREVERGAVDVALTRVGTDENRRNPEPVAVRVDARGFDVIVEAAPVVICEQERRALPGGAGN